jgi:hypothetical protein
MPSRLWLGGQLWESDSGVAALGLESGPHSGNQILMSRLPRLGLTSGTRFSRRGLWAGVRARLPESYSRVAASWLGPAGHFLEPDSRVAVLAEFADWPQEFDSRVAASGLGFGAIPGNYFSCRIPWAGVGAWPRESDSRIATSGLCASRHLCCNQAVNPGIRFLCRGFGLGPRPGSGNPILASRL